MSKKKTIEVLLRLEYNEDYGQLTENCIQKYFGTDMYNTAVKVTEISRSDIRKAKTREKG